MQRSGRTPVRYRIVVRGEVTPRFAEPLEDVVVEPAKDQTVLHVRIVDQARLQSILGWLFEHGIDLLSVHPADGANPGGVAPGSTEEARH